MTRALLARPGRYWVDDYGDPAKEDDFRILRGYSPYHNVRSGVRYPATLVSTAEGDDRVWDAEARKMSDYIRQQEKLTPELEQAILAADTKQRLEDLYAPYKPKRRTRAQIAREAGLEPLADLLWSDPMRDPATEAAAYVKKEKGENGDDFTTVPAVLDGVRDILSERWGDTPVAVDPFGRSLEFSLRYAVIFELRGAGDRVIVPRQTIELSRDYISNPTNSIGTEGEREILQRELRREMAASILRRIDAVAPLPEPALPAAQEATAPTP